MTDPTGDYDYTVETGAINAMKEGAPPFVRCGWLDPDDNNYGNLRQELDDPNPADRPNQGRNALPLALRKILK